MVFIQRLDLLFNSFIDKYESLAYKRGRFFVQDSFVKFVLNDILMINDRFRR